MDQMIAMEDDETEDELQIIAASFADPYLLILREDSSGKIFKASAAEVEDMEWEALSSKKWLSGSLFRSSNLSDVFAFLLSPEGNLQVSKKRHY